jgi:hypothetical protein
MRAVLLRKIHIAKRAMKLHSRTQHMGVHNELFAALRTLYFDGLTHSVLLNRMLTKATSLREGYGWQASGILSRSASFGEMGIIPILPFRGLRSLGPCWMTLFSILLFLVCSH